MQSSIGLHGAMVTRSFASFNIVLLAAAVGNQWRENAKLTVAAASQCSRSGIPTTVGPSVPVGSMFWAAQRRVTRYGEAWGAMTDGVSPLAGRPVRRSIGRLTNGVWPVGDTVTSNRARGSVGRSRGRRRIVMRLMRWRW